MKKFKKENLILIFTILLLLGGGIFYLKKDQIPLYILKLNQGQTIKKLEGTWDIEGVVDEESFTIKNIKSKEKPVEKLAIKKLKKKELEITNVSLKKSYQRSVDVLPDKEEFGNWKKTIDDLVKVFNSNLYGDFNHSLFLKYGDEKSYLVLNKEKNYLFWYEAEELLVLKKEE